MNLGKYGNTIKELGSVFDTTDEESLKKYSAVLKKLTNVTDIKDFITTSKATKPFTQKALEMTTFPANIKKDIKAMAEISEVVDSLPDGKKFLNINDAFLSLGNGIKYLSSTTPGLIAPGAIGVFGGLMALSTLTDEWKKYRGFDYDTNQTKSSSAIGKYENISSELDATIAKLKEIKSMKETLASNAPFSFTNKDELQDLQLEYYTLKQQEQLLQTMSNAEKAAASNAAARAMATTQESDVSSARFDHNINGEAYLDLNHKNVSYMNDAEQIKSLVTEITSVNSQMERLQELQSATTDVKQIKKYQDQIEDLNAYQLDLNNSLSERLKTASTNYSAIVGDEKYADLAKEYESAFLSIENMGKSTKEVKQNTLEHFFTSTDNQLLSNSLLDIARQGELTENVLKNLGITTGMIGKDVNVDDVIDYFNNLATAADRASASVKSLADTESIDSVTAAFNSKNAGYNYEQAITYSQKAADLFNQGLVGTDDFKAFADYISYGMDDSIEAYQTGMEKFNRYFTAENDSGLQNFIQDFKEMRSLGEDDDWISNIGSTAQLAKDMGIGIGAVEDILSRMEDYGYITSDQWHSSLDDLAEYKSSLAALEELSNSMDSGEEKESLGSNIEEWKANLQMYEDDLSLLDENAVIKIKFAYDNAQLQQEVDNSLALAEASGQSDSAVTNYANALVGQEEIIRNYEESLGLDREGITIPAAYDTTALYEQLRDATENEDIIEIQAEIIDKNESYKTFLESLSEQHPELTPELNIDDANDIVLQKKIKVDESAIKEVQHEDGTISYTADINGVTIPAEKKEENGVVFYTVNTKDVFAFTPPEKDGIASYTDDCSGISRTAPTIYGTAIYTAVNMASNIASAFFGGHATGTLLSPAHADGKVSLPQNETALVNELGTESIIRNGKWMLIPGGMHREHLKKGDIILNANQTKSLMKYGKAAGKGRAYADGTLNSVLSNAYASGSGDTPEPETFDWIENRIKHLESLTEDWKKKLESVTTFKAQNSYISQIILAIQNEISNLNESYNAYMAKAASLGLSSDYVQKIQSGQLVLEDITDEDLQEKIKNYQDWYDKAEDCRKSIEDLKLDVKDLNEEQVDNITNDFGNLSSLFKTIIGHYETLNELAKKQGKSLGRTDYDALIKYNNELKAVKSEELKNMQAEFDRLMKTQEGFAGSDLYMDMQEHIFSLKDDIASINIELEDIKDSIVESDFSAFKKNEAHLKSFADELDRIGDLLNENNFFNDNGSFTSVGYTKIALISEQITTARQLMAEYENAIDQLGKHLSKGNISQEEYNESLEEYREGAQNAAADVKRYKEAILDLVKDGLKQELDSNKELISARKEALKGLKDYDNYQKKIKDKNKDIQQLQAQLAALEGQTGQNVDRQRRELQAKLKELEADKQELMDDRAYDLRMEGYDKAQDDLQERFDAYIKDLESNTQTQEKVIANTLKNVQDNYGAVAGELNKIGVDMSADIAKPWLSAKNAAKQYTDAMKDAAAKSTIVTDKIDTSKRENQSVIQSIAPKPAEKEYKAPPAETPQQLAAPSGPKSPNDLGLEPSPSTKGLSWLLKEVSIHDRLLYNGWATSDRNYQLLHEWAGGQGGWTGTAEQNIHILNALKAAGFSHGGILQATGEDGIFLGRNKEAVLTETQWNTIRDLADTAPVLVHALPQFSAPQSPDTVTNVFDAPLIQVEGKADEYTVRELRQLARSIAPMIGKEFYKDARKIGLK